ncbi:tyrosine-type recombinase/integrase [Sphingobium sp. RAC03]|uniref:tyrosine-type recombinase/integrase n=1 Tax=Sphingobium sp. RAC03 TaxID=1843368 RepID=UPI00083CFD08|nr:site-specific integrase [Sphingobium sp. RAC03]AOF96514.1 phage integrase [Sphingobium sp. RAC03]
MHLRNKLNVKKIASLDVPNVYSDGGGLYLRVRKSGTKSWLFIYMLRGKRREIGLGSVLDVSLAAARKTAEELRTIQLAGRDPAEARKLARPASARITTFADVATELIDTIEGGFKNEKHRKQWRSTIDTYAKPLLPMAVDQITMDDVASVLKPIWLTKSETASRVRQRIERILDAATVKGLRRGDNPARLKGNLEIVLPRKSKGEDGHHQALLFPDVPAFMTALASRQAPSARALEFTILTAARTGETLGMKWEEVQLDQRLWTIPANRMKMGRAHQVPLSDPAVAILQSLAPADPDPKAHVFRGAGGSSLSNMAMLTLLKRMEVPVTVHGFRSSFRDWAGETTSHGREEIEMALAHDTLSKTEKAYRRGNALDKRRSLMRDWAHFILPSGESGTAQDA